MGVQTKIDWDKCSRHSIVAGSALPSNIRALDAPTMDAHALKRAFDQIGGDVMTVQIMAEDVPKDLLGFPHDYIGRSGRFNLELLPIEFSNGFVRTNDADIERKVCQDFAVRINAATDDVTRTHLTDWRDCVLRMSRAVSEVFPNAYKGIWIRGDGRFDQREKPGFHRHGAFEDILGKRGTLPGYFLNFAPSYDGTVFPDERGDLWYAQGGSYVLFTSDGHPHVDGCDHEVPDRFLSPIDHENRATAVMQIFPFRDI